MRPMQRRTPTCCARAALALLSALAAGCGPGDVVEIADSRTASRPSRQVALGVTSAQRFEAGFRPEPQMSPFVYQIPPGWHELETSDFRLVNLAVTAHPEVHCWVSVLPGDGGGIMENITRWHRQMGVPPPTEEEVAALPQRRLFARSAVYVTVDGDYAAVEGGAQENWRMLVLFAGVAQNTVYVKMVGPVAVIEEEAGRFEAFCDTLRLRMDGGATPQAAPPGGEAPWEVPDSWRQVSGNEMRLLDFDVGADTECYVSRFGGEVLDNANRWRAQLGLAPFTPAEFEQLERVTVMGMESVLVECTGEFKGIGATVGKPGTTLLGTISDEGQGRVLFIKMVGPADEVTAARDDFLVFARSLGTERR